MTPAFAARHSPWRVLLMILGAALFVVLGAWIAGLVGDPPRPRLAWFGWIAMAFFGLCGAVGVPRLFDRANALEISSQGILYRPWSDVVIPWTAIVQVTVWKNHNTGFIILHLRHPERFPSARLLGKLAGANRRLTGGDVAIGMTDLDRSLSETLSAIAQWIPAKVRG